MILPRLSYNNNDNNNVLIKGKCAMSLCHNFPSCLKAKGGNKSFSFFSDLKLIGKRAVESEKKEIKRNNYVIWRESRKTILLFVLRCLNGFFFCLARFHRQMRKSSKFLLHFSSSKQQRSLRHSYCTSKTLRLTRSSSRRGAINSPSRSGGNLH